MIYESQYSPFLNSKLVLTMSLDLLLIIFCLIVIIETIYDQRIENQYNEEVNYRIQRILNNINYLFRSR